jgi:hypothetical protein
MRATPFVVALLVGLLLIAILPTSALARVVSYLVGASEVPSPWAPDPAFDPTPFDWRIHDPASGRDFSFLRLPGSPTRIRWDRSFRFVEFKIGRRVFRAPWGPDTRASIVVELPVDSTVCDFWREERDSSWNYESVRPLARVERNGRILEMALAERWKSSDRGARWSLVRMDSCWEAHCGCALEAPPSGSSATWVTLDALQDSMRVWNHPYRGLRAAPPNANADSIVTTHVAGFPGARLEFAQGSGDTDHAMAPMVYVNDSRGIRATIGEEDTMMDFGQIAFQQEGPYLLVAGEYEGGNARVADLRSGTVVFHAPRRARWAVWAPWPK